MGLRSTRHALGETGRGINRSGGWVRWSASVWERRMERPEPEEPKDLLILLRQASDSADAAVLRALAPVIEQHLGRLRPAHLTHVHILRRLALREITATHLVDYLTRSKARVAALVDELESAGLVERSEDAFDARHKRLVITDAGRELVREADEVLEDMVDLISDDIGDIEELATRLARLADLR